MPYPAFPLDPSGGPYGRLAPGTNRSTAPRVLRAGFGGGYEQRTGDGINQIVRTWTARFENLDRTQAKVINDFLTSRKGYLPFTHPFPEQTAPVQVTCADWSSAYNEPDYETITATFVENFDP